MSETTRRDASTKIAERVGELLAQRLSIGQVVGLYHAKGSEVDTAAIDAEARASGLVVAYPRVVERARALTFHDVARDALEPSRFGLLEPAADAPAIGLDRIAAFVIPGLAFDREGGRIGWGMGHYDATLAATPAALRIGLAFECQVVEQLAREAHDVVVHIIITEATTHVVA